jgi:hypothetical protein
MKYNVESIDAHFGLFNGYADECESRHEHVAIEKGLDKNDNWGIFI